MFVERYDPITFSSVTCYDADNVLIKPEEELYDISTGKRFIAIAVGSGSVYYIDSPTIPTNIPNRVISYEKVAHVYSYKGSLRLRTIEETKNKKTD